MKQIVEQVMAAMKNGTPASAPAAASSCGSKVTAANYPLAESMADQIKTPTGKDFTSLSYEKVINGELSAGMAGSFNLCDVRDLAHGCVMAADRGRRGE